MPDIKIVSWIIQFVCAKAIIIDIYNLKINLVYKNIENILKKTRYILNSNIKKNSLKLEFF